MQVYHPDDADAALRARVEIANIEAILPQAAKGETATALGWRWIRIGDTREMLGSVTTSLAAFDHARTCFGAAAYADPMNSSLQRNVSVAWNRLGSVRETHGDLPGAFDAYNQDMEITANPGNAGWQHDLAVSWEKLGGVR